MQAETLNQEPILNTTTTVRTRDEKPGDLGAHRLRMLRGYEVRRFSDNQQRQQFVFSTLSGYVLALVGSIYVDWSGLRSLGAERAPIAA